jgi:hypothetical protein
VKEGTPFWCFIAFLLTSFAKNLEGRYTFIPPHSPTPCVHLCCNVFGKKSVKVIMDIRVIQNLIYGLHKQKEQKGLVTEHSLKIFFFLLVFDFLFLNMFASHFEMKQSS